MLDILRDDKADGNPRAASTRIKSATARKLSGQIRHDLRRGPQPKYVDDDRTKLNRIIIKPETPGVMRKICKERRDLRETKREMKSNAAVATVGIITFGGEAAQMFGKLTAEQQDAAFGDVAEAVAERLATSLHGLTVHLDEATIHAHYQLAAYNEYGNPISQTTSPRVLSELQTITAEIMAKHCPGIERGHRYGDRLAAGAEWSDVINKSVKELHRTLPADLAKKRAELAEVVDAEVAAQARVEQMQKRVTKLEQKEELSEKEITRLETYQKRLADRQAALEAAQKVSEAAKVEADRLAGLARADREAEEARAAKVSEKTEAVEVAVAALTDEVGAQTISRTAKGKIKSKDAGKLKPGFPEIIPAVNAAADFVMKMQESSKRMRADADDIAAQRVELAQEQQDLFAEMSAIEELKIKLQAAISQVARWLKRPDLPREARREAVEMVNTKDELLTPPEDAVDDTGPGF